MGASAREIEQQIKETRERMDENLGALENRAATGAQRYGKIGVAVVAAVGIAAAGYFIWRKTRRPALKNRLEQLSPESLHELVEEVIARLKKPLPSVRITVNERAEHPGTVERFLRKVAPAVAGTAATGLLRRVTARPAEEEA
jgi:hypothetical protein